MARQRFIWPTIWDDPDLGRLSSDARLLYIGCFSLADDDGRIIGDPTYLKTNIFRYRPTTPGQVARLRDEIASSCRSFKVYEVAGIAYIAFLNWSEFQKPKYPTPSKLPAPPGRRSTRKPASGKEKSSGNDSGNRSGRDSGKPPGTIPPRDGLGLDPPTPRGKGTNPRARGTSPRQRGTNPRAKSTLACPRCGINGLTPTSLPEHLEIVHGILPGEVAA